MSREEYEEMTRLLAAIDIGGNDGADIYEYQVYIEMLQAKYGSDIDTLVHEYLDRLAGK